MDGSSPASSRVARPSSHLPAKLTALLGHTFRDPALLRRALRHPSAADVALDSYERLEFLGDRVLGLIVAEELLARFPEEPEGYIARRHTALVRRDTAAEIAAAIGLGEHLDVSKGEHDAGTRDNPAILADALEALLGALYLDGGLPAARAFIDRHWAGRIAAMRQPPLDPKTALQEWAQARGLPLPSYRETAREGPPHAPNFTVSVTIEGNGDTAASGASKRRAEQAAAAAMLDRLEDG